jgi:hypothetical protein
VSIDTDFDGEKCFPRIEAARRTVSGQEPVARYDLTGEFMKRSATGEWIRFDDAAPIPATDQE